MHTNYLLLFSASFALIVFLFMEDEGVSYRGIQAHIIIS